MELRSQGNSSKRAASPTSPRSPIQKLPRQYRNYSKAGVDCMPVFERVDQGLKSNSPRTRNEVAEEYGIHPHALGRRYSAWVKGGRNCDGT